MVLLDSRVQDAVQYVKQNIPFRMAMRYSLREQLIMLGIILAPAPTNYLCEIAFDAAQSMLFPVLPLDLQT